MVSEAVNITVLALFGILVGVSLQVFSTLAVRRRAGPSTRTLIHRPRSFWVSLTVVYAIIGLIVLTIRFTPVQMRWIPFLVSAVAAHAVMAWVFEAAKTGRLGRGPDHREPSASG